MIKTWVAKVEGRREDIEDSLLQPMEAVKERLNYFRGISRKGIHNLSRTEYVQLIEDINHYFVAWGYWVNKIPDNREFYRVVVNKRIIGENRHFLRNISQLVGPPLECLKNPGRCNGLDISVFYASDSLKAAIFEAIPEIGDCITVSRWRLKPGKSLFYCHIFHPEVTAPTDNNKILFEEYQKTSNSDSPKRAEIMSENVRFLTEEFIKQVEGTSPINYLFSCLFSEGIFKMKPTLRGEVIESIQYPSTKLRNGQMNIAVPNSLVHEKFDLIEIGFTTIQNIWATPDVSFRDIDMQFEDFRVTRDFDMLRDQIGH